MTATETLCLHCRTPFVAGPAQREFCCAGCQFVYRLLHEKGLEEFYRYGDAITPAPAEIFKAQDFTWLDEKQDAVEALGGGQCELVLDVQGISCAACLWLLEQVFTERRGALSCQASSVDGTVRLRWAAGTLRLSDYAAEVRRFGYFLGPLAEGAPARSSRGLVVRMGICGALALNAMLFSLPLYLGLDPHSALGGLFLTIAAFIASLSLLLGGSYFFRRAFAVLQSGVLHIDLPISLGLIAAYSGSVVAWVLGKPSFVYFDFIAIFSFLMLAGRWVQERAVETNRARLLQTRVDPGSYRLVATAETVNHQAIRRGMRIAVDREKLIPVRARLISAAGTVGLSWITGEPHPRSLCAGAIVPSGAKNFSPEPLEVEALEDWPDAQLARLLALETTGPWRNDTMQRVMRIYLAGVLVTAALGFAGWLIVGGDWVWAMQVLVSVLVVSCPCSLGVALPLLDDLTAARLQHEGLYVRDGSLWARLRRVRQILFDKTGTITLENLVLADRRPVEALTDRDRAALLQLVNDSLHPVATCLRETLLADGVRPLPEAEAARETVGFGLEWRQGPATWRLGRSGWAAGGTGDGATVFARDGVVLAELRFREEIRPLAIQQIRALRAAGYRIALLSGDHPDRVRAMAEKLGLLADSALGGLSPAEKADRVRALDPEGSLMIGDGANDSLAFDAALCRGTPAVTSGLLEQKSDFYLLGRSLGGLEHLLQAAQCHGRTTFRVFAFAVTYNAAAIACSLAGLMNPLLAAIIMPLSSLVSLSLVLLSLRGRAAFSHPPSLQPIYANA